MYVGVILTYQTEYAIPESIPHVCGGDPLPGYHAGDNFVYSPCMWG